MRSFGRHKYGARVTEYGGEVYPSAAEAARAAELELLRRAGEIRSWVRGSAVLIVDAGPGRRVTYKPDFIVCESDGRYHAEDVKGAVPRDFRMRAILYEQATRIPLRVVDKHGAVIWTPEGMGRKRRGGE